MFVHHQSVAPTQIVAMAAAVTTSVKETINLNDDCPEYIFNNLGLNDLINVSEINESFQLAASRSFKNKFKNKWTQEMDKVDHEKLLLNFGYSMTYLRIRGLHGVSGIEMHKLIEYTQKRSNLFEKIKTIEFSGLFESTSEIEKHIDCVQSLNSVYASTQNSKIIERKFPSLKTLTVKNYMFSIVQPSNIFTNNNIEIALSLNPQLLNLSLSHGPFDIGIDANANMLLFISRTCPVLQNLDIEFESDKYYLFEKSHEPAVFNELKECTLSISSDKMLVNFPVLFHRLQSLKLNIKTAVTGETFRFAMQNDSLRDLQITFSASIESFLVDNSDIIALMTLSNIEHIFIQFPIALSGYNINQLVSRCEKVLKLHLKFVVGGEMIIIQGGLPTSVHNMHINPAILDTELNLLRSSRINERWDWNTSIQYSQENIDAVELLFRRKMHMKPVQKMVSK